MKEVIQAIHPSEHEDYLRDEARRPGSAVSISFPRTEDEIRQILVAVQAGGLAVTTQGARTGITGGAVPQGGHILNLSRMDRILGLRHDKAGNGFFVTVQPGVVLSELRAAIEAKSFDTAGWTGDALAALAEFRESGAWFFPPDPTETSATLGGMVACNASGACSFHYGPMRRPVRSLRVVLPDGDTLSLRRGCDRACGRAFAVTTASGRVLRGNVPSYVMPDVKNAAGYHAAADMDLVDLFVGSEGTLGIISEIEVALLPSPVCRWGVMAFFPAEAPAVAFVESVRGESGARRPVAIEFFDWHSLNLLRGQKATHPAFKEIPAMPAEFDTGIYVEYHGDEPEVTDAVERMLEAMAAAGGSAEATWVAATDGELERLKFFRHAVPESVNSLIAERKKTHSEIAKLGTDMAVPDVHLAQALNMYRRGLAVAGLDFVMFGHIGDNHLHVNILPRNVRDYEVGKDLYLQWARAVVGWGGTVSAEHGIGKFKVALLREMYGDDGIRQMREVKRIFDPAGKLNPGNLF